MKDLYIIGAGGFGREVVWLIERINEVKPTWNIKGFIDDKKSLWGTFEEEYPVLGGCEYLADKEDVYVVCAVGTAAVRRKVIAKLQETYVQFATLIDPSVLISKRVKVGEGTIICAGTIITVDIEIGSHVIINLNCTIGHDAIIHDYVTIYPSVNVSGNVQVGECSELGTGTRIVQGKSVASSTIIGAGSVVARNIEESGTYVGCPVKRIK